jgi:glutathionylspermidine synthase
MLGFFNRQFYVSKKVYGREGEGVRVFFKKMKIHPMQKYPKNNTFFAPEKVIIFEFLKSRKLINLARILNFYMQKTYYFGVLLLGVTYGPKKFFGSRN